MSSAADKRIRDILETFAHFRREGRTVPEREIMDDIIALGKYERALSKINENEANGWPRERVERRDGQLFRYNVQDAAWQERDQRREKALQVKVGDIADKYGFGCQFNGDPRGGAIRFILPSGASNGWDGKTWGIYW